MERAHLDPAPAPVDKGGSLLLIATARRKQLTMDLRERAGDGRVGPPGIRRASVARRDVNTIARTCRACSWPSLGLRRLGRHATRCKPKRDLLPLHLPTQSLLTGAKPAQVPRRLSERKRLSSGKSCHCCPQLAAYWGQLPHRRA